ncbi:MAG: hypothetical protein ACM3O3_05290 [Syntrophothermus sp.]
MSGFKWARDLNGSPNAMLRDFYIPAATVVVKGEPLYFTPGTGLVKLSEAECEDFDVPPLCVANRGHDGSTTGYDTGLKLECSYSPTAVYKYNTMGLNYILTGGSTTTAVVGGLLPATNSIWKGGKIRIVSCAADSTLNGRICTISDSTGGTGTLTLGETLPAALAVGDTINIVPGPLMDDTVGYDLWYNNTLASGGVAGCEIDFTGLAGGNKCLRILYSNPDTFDVFVMFEQSVRLS